MENLQPSVYCSKGISSVFYYATIKGSTLEFQQLEIKGLNFKKGENLKVFNYSIECSDNDSIEFKDRISNNEIKVEKIHKNLYYNINKKFDPEKREE